MASPGGPQGQQLTRLHRTVSSSGPRAPSQDKVLARPGRSQLRDAAPGQKHHHRIHFWCCRLLGQLGGWNPSAVRGPNAHHSTAHTGMRRATMAGLARYPARGRPGSTGPFGCRASSRNLLTHATGHHCQETGMLRATARLRGPTGSSRLAGAGPHSGGTGRTIQAASLPPGRAPWQGIRSTWPAPHVLK